MVVVGVGGYCPANLMKNKDTVISYERWARHKWGSNMIPRALRPDAYDNHLLVLN